MTALELPIILNAEEVRAFLDGTKTQARLPIENPPPDTDPPTDWGWHEHGGLWYAYDADCPDEGHYDAYSCPFGKPGDRLWVRETWGVNKGYDSMPAWMVHVAMGGDVSGCIDYRANPRDEGWTGEWRPSASMPRWASRITLGVKRVWIEHRLWCVEFERVQS